MNKLYRQQVELLLKIIPTLSGIESFAIHGGTAINLYVLDLPRYSVDIDVTYTPLKPREEAFAEIHKNLSVIKEKVKAIIPNVVISEKPNKIYCSQKGVMVKVEVSGTKRGLIEPYEIRPLCEKAQNEFETTNKAKIVSLSQLYGGKITAALDRQHPRDLFDVKLMFDFVTDFEQIKKGFLYCLLGGDRPIVETLSPNRIDQQETMIKQFSGMTDIPFSYSDYEETSEKLIDFINSNLTQQDKEFLIAFEAGNELLYFSEYQEYLLFPSVQWKLQNISKLKEINPSKLKDSIKKLEKILS
ncbi:MAG: nucleotidyl transferase AbiEii/AbiGii toxin family protein [Tannerella sp.]|jgi:predicted nucleotidyltransferase component of viral defense system|nr:nucleotidyl transferase AbiEii/AbiGii toxin family protein [Tannerella sp.]